MHAGHWDKSTHKSTELGGKTLGLLGLGAIGRRMAKMAHAMEMRVMGFDPFASGLPDYIEQVPLQTIWKEADAISLHCPLTEENRRSEERSAGKECVSTCRSWWSPGT